ncbi:MAG: PSD1 and planctomycete cytochrome C domain-containing protein [Opitutaceae bacterium]|nr:PSD1 and planctomycete cytochrome C domain-containing protein [Opitutaceae bacterium]
MIYPAHRAAWLPHACTGPVVRVGLIVLLVAGASALRGAETRVDFGRDIQPILAGRCYDCHGLDHPKAGLHLTTAVQARAGGRSGLPALVPGAPEQSEIFQRIISPHEDEVMPQKGDRLKPAEIALLKRWIEEGALWPDNLRHWAYVKPSRPALPVSAAASSAGGNPIDAFVFARLAQEGLAPSPPADRARWLRRVSLDLIGLPPTTGEIAAFLADDAPGDQPFERVVDRLLASPHYGERWARPWLDLARYADSHGFQRDDLRDLWPYRDWVVRAMNADLPFDRFTIMQLAGDLLPEADAEKNPDPLIATGFHRAAPTNVEAGTDQEEGRVNQVFDRVNTTATVWLGSTLECAQCHNHKYDPFTQRDYYRLFAYFNSTERETEFASAKALATLKFTGPYLALPVPADDAKRAALAARLRDIDREIAVVAERLRGAAATLEAEARAKLETSAQLHPLDITAFESTGGSAHRLLPDKSVLLDDEEAPERDTYTLTVRTPLTGITGFKLEALADSALPGGGPGRAAAPRPNFVLNNLRIALVRADGTTEPVPLVRAEASFSQARFAVASLLKSNTKPAEGWAISPQFGRDHWATFATERPLGSADGATFVFTLEQNNGGSRTIGRLRLSALTGVAQGPALPATVAAVLRTPAPARTLDQRRVLENHWLAQDPAGAKLRETRQTLARELDAIAGPRTLVMRELREPRATHVLNRGNFLDPGERVTPGTPESLPIILEGGTRLDLARWLASADNPLVARVTVNRWWQEFFGHGLVRTPEDFGIKGEAPTHPALLDWLAVEFAEGGWSMKRLHRLITLSATYRQSSRVTPELLALDDQNRLLARGPRFRLEAEAVRDNALAIAGLLSAGLGGPPVRPPQPAGLWDSKIGGERVTYEVSTGADAHRRGLYTVWKRASPYPSFMNFDATARTACTVRRSRSNTPLQALTLLNDPVYVEAAAALAHRVLREQPDASEAGRLRHAFMLCVAREPAEIEQAALHRLLAQQRRVHDDATAWQAVAAALLNLDETITKN